MKVDSTTQIWRERIVRDATMLHIGDQISASSVVHYPREILIGENIWVGVESASNQAANEQPHALPVPENGRSLST